MEKLAQEIVDQIFRHLPARSLLTAAKLFKLRHDPKCSSYIEIWTSIFKDETWTSKALEHGVNPLLLGSDLKHSPYMALVAQDYSGDLQLWEQNKKTFLQSLQEHTFDDKAKEVRFKSGLVVHVGGVLQALEHVILPPRKLFSSKDVRLSYMFVEDQEKRIQTLLPDNIRGLRNARHRRQNRIPELRVKHLTLVCGLLIYKPQGDYEMVIFIAPEVSKRKTTLVPFFANPRPGIPGRDPQRLSILGWDEERNI